MTLIVPSTLSSLTFPFRCVMRIPPRIGFNRGRYRWCMRVSTRIGCSRARFPNQCCIVFLNFPLRTVSIKFDSVPLLFFRVTKFPLAGECSLGIVSKDGVADCFVCATMGTTSPVRSIVFFPFVTLRILRQVVMCRTILTHRIVVRTTIPKQDLPPTSRKSMFPSPGCKPALHW